MRSAWIWTAFCVGLCGRQAGGTVWLGELSTHGPVQRPRAYVAAVDHLAKAHVSFDSFQPGQLLNGVACGPIVLRSHPWQPLTAQKGPVAGVEPTSRPMALDVPAGPTATQLQLYLPETAMSLGLVLMGLDCETRIDLYRADGRTLRTFRIPAGQSDTRQWLGVVESEKFTLAVITPLQARGFGVDDLEIGLHAPEPATLIVWSAAAGLALGRRHRRRIP